MKRRTRSSPLKISGDTFIGYKKSISNKYKVTVNNTYMLIRSNSYHTYKKASTISYEGLKVLKTKGYYKLKLRNQSLNKQALQRQWRGGRVVFYSYKKALPDLRRQDLLVVENKRGRCTPKTKAAVLDIIKV